MRTKVKALLFALALGVTAMTPGLTWAGSPAPAGDERGAGSPPTDSSDPAARRNDWQGDPWPTCGHPLQSMNWCYSAAARDAEAMGKLVTGTPVRCESYGTRLEAKRAAQQVLQASGVGRRSSIM